MQLHATVLSECEVLELVAEMHTLCGKKRSQQSVSHSNPGQEDQVKLASPAGWASL